jgi:hypothetical protein
MNYDQSAHGLAADATRAADRILEALEKTPTKDDARTFLIGALADILDDERTTGLRHTIEAVQHLRRASVLLAALGSLFGLLIGLALALAYAIWWQS